jgi:hypothetical protein
MKAIELLPGQEFKRKGQRKFRIVKKIIELTDHDEFEPIGRKVLIIIGGCKQVVLLSNT